MLLERRIARGGEVGRSHSSPGPVPEHERTAGVLGEMQVRAREPVRRLDLERPDVRARYPFSIGRAYVCASRSAGSRSAYEASGR